MEEKIPIAYDLFSYHALRSCSYNFGTGYATCFITLLPDLSRLTEVNVSIQLHSLIHIKTMCNMVPDFVVARRLINDVLGDS